MSDMVAESDANKFGSERLNVFSLGRFSLYIGCKAFAALRMRKVPKVRSFHFKSARLDHKLTPTVEEIHRD